MTPTSSSNCVRNISSRRAVPSKRKSSRKPSTPPSTNASSCSSVSLLSAAFLFFFHNKYIAFTFLVVSPLVSVVVRAHACTSRWWITIYWLRTTSQARLSFPWPIFLELVAKLWADLVRSPLSVSPSPTLEELGVSFFSIREPISCVEFMSEVFVCFHPDSCDRMILAALQMREHDSVAQEFFKRRKAIEEQSCAKNWQDALFFLKVTCHDVVTGSSFGQKPIHNT